MRWKSLIITSIFLCLWCINSWAQDATEEDYTIGPRDILEIQVYGEEDLHRTLVVAPDGFITFPLIHEFKIEGLSVRKAEIVLEHELAKTYLNKPQVSITVKEFKSRNVYVLGAVKNPGYYPLKGRTTILEIISIAGGINTNGSKQMLLLRGTGVNKEAVAKLSKGEKSIDDFTRESNGNAPIVIDGYKLLEGGDTSLNLILRDQDVLYIPAVKQVYVMGEVQKPGGVPYEDGINVVKAITLAGGLTQLAKNKVQITRVFEGKTQRFFVKISKATKDPNKDIVLMPDDIIVIQRRIF